MRPGCLLDRAKIYANLRVYFISDSLKATKLGRKARALIDLLRENPFQNPPPYEKLQGDLQGAYSRRINIKHRLVYEVMDDQKSVKILSMWTHYEF